MAVVPHARQPLAHDDHRQQHHGAGTRPEQHARKGAAVVLRQEGIHLHQGQRGQPLTQNNSRLGFCFLSTGAVGFLSMSSAAA